ncbi:50S ribosomal protein L7 [Vulcanibacillus modesticaldus]|uniref:50S ribosomal protein L7 n=1 Tax=Vulcanibacillus modesticaldus TaxID=337097 RepID=A0A1D2YXJ8_9BACI|nr:YlxQ family RNA-binding protein [Vulcanibacillus modesticaldus]OEG00442.1 50S ribosomal protein L7 [Vulcanibacillus modesticaldus]
MKNNKFFSLLGLAARARKIISGEELLIKGIQTGKVFLVIIAQDASENTRKKLTDKCSYYNIPYKVSFEREQLGHAIGKFSRVAIGITDQGFSKQLNKILEE